MRKYIQSMIVLWRAPADVKAKAEKEMKCRLDAFPQNPREGANRLRCKNEWKIALAAKVKSVLADEESAQKHHGLDRLAHPKTAAEVAESIKAVAAANSALLHAQVLKTDFELEWGTFIRCLAAPQ
jgi:hypothetical protein